MNMTEAEAYSNLIVGLVGDYNMIGKPVKAGDIIDHIHKTSQGKIDKEDFTGTGAAGFVWD